MSSRRSPTTLLDQHITTLGDDSKAGSFAAEKIKLPVIVKTFFALQTDITHLYSLEERLQTTLINFQNCSLSPSLAAV